MDWEIALRYVVVPLFTVIFTVAWFMIKRLDSRVDDLEKTTFDIEKDVIEIKTSIRKDIQYIAEDVKEIKELLKGYK